MADLDQEVQAAPAEEPTPAPMTAEEKAAFEEAKMAYRLKNKIEFVPAN